MFPLAVFSPKKEYPFLSDFQAKRLKNHEGKEIPRKGVPAAGSPARRLRRRAWATPAGGVAAAHHAKARRFRHTKRFRHTIFPFMTFYDSLLLL